MKKNTGKIITGILGVIFIAVTVTVFIFWRSDVEYYEAQIEEYRRGIDELGKSISGGSDDLAAAKQQIVQLESDLQAYKEAVEQVNAERIAAREESEAEKKAKEDEWNALSEVQKDAISRGAERAKVTNYLLYHSEEYAELYAFMRDLSDRGLVELSNSEYRKYKEAKTRMNELEAEAKTMIATEETN